MKVPSGFTIVELLVVVVVIAILAAITIVAYNGVANQAKESALKSDVTSAVQQLQIIKIESGSFPSTTTAIKRGQYTDFQYTYTSDTFCLTATSSQLPGRSFYVTQEGTMQEGACAPAITYIQTVTTANCPTSPTTVADARDNKTYWVRLLADGKCWMLTNLAYAGGGTATYSDVKTLINGTADSAVTYLEAKYYIPPAANATSDPTQPSTSTDAGATNPQYGYHYNWCAAMGAQTTTSACANAATPLPNTTISICPAGWRLPTGGSGGEYPALNTAINGGLTNSNAGLRTTWLGQHGGYWYATFGAQGTTAYYWGRNQSTASGAHAFVFGATSVSPVYVTNKHSGFSVRCIAT